MGRQRGAQRAARPPTRATGSTSFGVQSGDRAAIGQGRSAHIDYPWAGRDSSSLESSGGAPAGGEQGGEPGKQLSASSQRAAIGIHLPAASVPAHAMTGCDCVDPIPSGDSTDECVFEDMKGCALQTRLKHRQKRKHISWSARLRVKCVPLQRAVWGDEDALRAGARALRAAHRMYLAGAKS